MKQITDNNAVVKKKKVYRNTIPEEYIEKSEIEKSAVSNYIYDDYLNLFTWKKMPVDDRFKDMLAQKLIKWAKEDENALKLSQFFLDNGISDDVVERWEKKHEGLRLAKKVAKQLIGNRREVGAMNRQFDSSMVKFTMPLYDPDWKGVEEWKSKLRVENEVQNESRIVVIEKYPDSPLVPVKKVIEIDDNER